MHPADAAAAWVAAVASRQPGNPRRAVRREAGIGWLAVDRGLLLASRVRSPAAHGKLACSTMAGARQRMDLHAEHRSNAEVTQFPRRRQEISSEFGNPPNRGHGDPGSIRRGSGKGCLGRPFVDWWNRAFRLCAAMHSPFRSGAASRADGGGDRSPPHPPSERGGVPLQNAEAMHSGIHGFWHSGIRPLRENAFAFRSGAASRADGSGDRSPPHPRSERGGVPLQNAEAMHSGIRGFWHSWIRPLRENAFAFRSGAASRADGSGDRSPPHPRSERGGVPLQNAEAMHAGIRGLGESRIPPLRGNAFAFRSGAASRADGSGDRSPLACSPSERGGVPLQNAEAMHAWIPPLRGDAFAFS